MTCRVLAPASGATGQEFAQQAFRLLKGFISVSCGGDLGQ